MIIKLNENPRYGEKDHWSYIDGVLKLRILLIGKCNITKTDELIKLIPFKPDQMDIEPFNQKFMYVPEIDYDAEIMNVHKFFWSDASGNHSGLFHDKGLYILSDNGDTLDSY